MRKPIYAGLLGALFFFTILPAQGGPITFHFTGVIFQVDAPLAGTFANGNSISGSYTFDPAAPDTDPADPTVGLYSSSFAYSVAAGSFASTGTGFVFNVFDNLVLNPGVLRDQYRVSIGPDGQSINGLPYNGFSLDLFTTAPNPTSNVSDALPSSPPNIGAFTNNQLRFYFVDPSSGPGVDYAIGTLSTLTQAPTQVPEPTTLALFGSGLAGAVATRRRKKNAA